MANSQKKSDLGLNVCVDGCLLVTYDQVMQRYIVTEKLQSMIPQFAAAAVDTRQVSRRMRSLLPDRLRKLRGEHSTPSVRGAKAERLALTDRRYTDAIEELAAIRSEADRARIQFETHRMLFEARQSLGIR